ncbi:MAG: twin-arginine translocase subunit TatC, partial [Massilibacteroides sp.]|nr:twin-arginine translocase subunit TatC [Massilibacteroides sp.]
MHQDEMSFWDHLEELRWTLFRTVLALFVFA